MEKFENKKFAVTLFLIGVFGIIISYLMSEKTSTFIESASHGNGYYYWTKVDVLFFEFNLKTVVSFLCFLIAISIYLFIYKTDDKVKSTLKFYSTMFKSSDSSFLRKVFSFYTSDSEVKVVQLTKEQSALQEIMVPKNFNTLFGVLLLIVQLVLLNVAIENLAVVFAIQLGIRFFGAYRCHKVAEHNIWGSGTWFFLGFIFPSIALFLSGLKSTLRKDLNLTINDNNQESNDSRGNDDKIDWKDMHINPVPKPSEEEIIIKKEVELFNEAFPVDGFTNEQKSKLKMTISNVYNQLAKSKGVEPDFKSLLENMKKYAGNETAKKQFNAYVLGWKLNEYADSDFEEAYESVFNNFDNIVL